MAAKSNGKPYLAYFKADIDNLGHLFVFGFKDGNRDYDTISRLTALSRMLDIFFTGWVGSTLEHSYKDCYTVFAGGDDLMVIGPWQQLLEFARFLNAEFNLLFLLVSTKLKGTDIHEAFGNKEAGKDDSL